jgi:hypothetical protein
MTGDFNTPWESMPPGHGQCQDRGTQMTIVHFGHWVCFGVAPRAPFTDHPKPPQPGVPSLPQGITAVSLGGVEHGDAIVRIDAGVKRIGRADDQAAALPGIVDGLFDRRFHLLRGAVG